MSFPVPLLTAIGAPVPTENYERGRAAYAMESRRPIPQEPLRNRHSVNQATETVEVPKIANARHGSFVGDLEPLGLLRSKSSCLRNVHGALRLAFVLAGAKPGQVESR
jgi:hypothetical protein